MDLCTDSTANAEGASSALSWAPVNIDGSKFLSKAWFGDTEYELLLFDQSRVWEERMSKNSIERRVQALNKRLRAPVQAIVAHLRSAAWPCLTGMSCEQSAALRFRVEQQEGQLTVKLKSELGDVPFYWEFCCMPATVTAVSRELICPLLSMTQVLQRQATELSALLLKKNAEIQDYKENGAVLSRGRLQTEPFEEETYRKSFNQRIPEILQDGLEFDSELQEMYVSICAARNAGKRKRSGEHRTASSDSRVPGPDKTSCVPTGVSNQNDKGQQVEEAHNAGTGETERWSSAVPVPPVVPSAVPVPPVVPSAVPVPPVVPSANRPIIHPKKKKAAGLFQ